MTRSSGSRPAAAGTTTIVTSEHSRFLRFRSPPPPPPRGFYYYYFFYVGRPIVHVARSEQVFSYVVLTRNYYYFFFFFPPYETRMRIIAAEALIAHFARGVRSRLVSKPNCARIRGIVGSIGHYMRLSSAVVYIETSTMIVLYVQTRQMLNFLGETLTSNDIEPGKSRILKKQQVLSKKRTDSFCTCTNGLIESASAGTDFYTYTRCKIHLKCSRVVDKRPFFFFFRDEIRQKILCFRLRKHVWNLTTRTKQCDWIQIGDFVYNYRAYYIYSRGFFVCYFMSEVQKRPRLKKKKKICENRRPRYAKRVTRESLDFVHLRFVILYNGDTATSSDRYFTIVHRKSAPSQKRKKNSYSCYFFSPNKKNRPRLSCRRAFRGLFTGPRARPAHKSRRPDPI